MTRVRPEGGSRERKRDGPPVLRVLIRSPAGPDMEFMDRPPFEITVEVSVGAKRFPVVPNRIVHRHGLRLCVGLLSFEREFGAASREAHSRNGSLPLMGARQGVGDTGCKKNAALLSDVSGTARDTERAPIGEKRREPPWIRPQLS